MPESDVSVVPANEASWDDLQAVFGRSGAAKCQCQRIKLGDRDWFAMPVEERAHRLREETDCGNPDADGTSGMVAYLDGEPVGWVAVEPRANYRMVSRSAGSRWSHGPTTGGCAGPRCRGPAEPRTRTTLMSGPSSASRSAPVTGDRA
jgi:hypothetical protein